jgi:arsenate reductase (glutaredoxin)
MIVYGIKNCNTVKSAVDWLKNKKIAFDFHDYKTKGVSEEKLKAWSQQVGWETLVNKKGTTWRQLDDAMKNKVTNEAAAIELMKEKTSIIKRPLLEEKGRVITLGFDEETFDKLLR